MKKQTVKMFREAWARYQEVSAQLKEHRTKIERAVRIHREALSDAPPKVQRPEDWNSAASLRVVASLDEMADVHKEYAKLLKRQAATLRETCTLADRIVEEAKADVAAQEASDGE